MAETSLMFDGSTYQSSDLRLLFHSLFKADGGLADGTGLIYNAATPTTMLITADGASGMVVKVTTASTPGYALLMGGVYRNNTSPNQSLSIQANSSGNSRIDAVVLCLNLSGGAYTGGGTNPYTSGQSIADKSIGLAVRVGTPAGSPVAPTPVRTITSPSTSGIYELVLGTVTVPNGAVNIATVTDKRGDTTSCPWLVPGAAAVHSLTGGGAALHGNVILAGAGVASVATATQTITITVPTPVASLTVGATTLTGAVILAVAGGATIGVASQTITITQVAVATLNGLSGALTIAGAGGLAVSAAASTVTIDAKHPTCAVYTTGTQYAGVTAASSAYTTVWTPTTGYTPAVTGDKAIVQLNMTVSATTGTSGDHLLVGLFVDGTQVGSSYTIPYDILTPTTFVSFAWDTGAFASTAAKTITVQMAGTAAGITIHTPPTSKYNNMSIIGYR